VYISNAFSLNMINKLTIFTALITALEILGIHSCHMKEVAPLTHCAEMWNDGLRAKYYGQGKPYGKKEFDKLLGNFGVGLHPFACPLRYKFGIEDRIY
jgi:hypothetical protein